MKKYKYINAVMLCIWTILIFYAAYIANGRAYGIDDADIFFAYAKNFSDGKGILYAEGVPPVEGYTSMLWMFLVSLLFLLGGGSGAVVLLAMLIFYTTHFFMIKLVDDFSRDDSAAILKITYVLLISASFGYVTWMSVALMDTALWGLLIVLMVHTLLRMPLSREGWLLSSIPFLLAPVARPEAIIVELLIIGLILIKLVASRRQISPAFFLLACFLFSIMAVSLFRVKYFGYLLPNTYYAKVSSDIGYNLKVGFEYFLGYVQSSFIVGAGLLISFLVVQRFILNKSYLSIKNFAYHEKRESWGLLSVFLVGCMSVPILTGGDHFNLFRFYQPIYPLLCFFLVFALSFYRIFKVPSRGAAIIVFIIWLFFFSDKQGWYSVIKNGSPVAHEFQIAINGRDLGTRLNFIFSGSPVGMPYVGVITAGGVARTYKGPVIDLMGLNNSFIAHFPGDRIGIKNHAAFEKDAFFKMNIDILVDSPDNGFAQAALKGLFVDERFTNEWVYGRVISQGDSTRFYDGFYKKEFISNLVANNLYLFKLTRIYDRKSAKWILSDQSER